MADPRPAPEPLSSSSAITSQLAALFASSSMVCITVLVLAMLDRTPSTIYIDVAVPPITLLHHAAVVMSCLLNRRLVLYYVPSFRDNPSRSRHHRPQIDTVLVHIPPSLPRILTHLGNTIVLIILVLLWGTVSMYCIIQGNVLRGQDRTVREGALMMGEGVCGVLEAVILVAACSLCIRGSDDGVGGTAALSRAAHRGSEYRVGRSGTYRSRSGANADAVALAHAALRNGTIPVITV